jgi:hypothetical protein
VAWQWTPFGAQMLTAELLVVGVRLGDGELAARLVALALKNVCRREDLALIRELSVAAGQVRSARDAAEPDDADTDLAAFHGHTLVP